MSRWLQRTVPAIFLVGLVLLTGCAGKVANERFDPRIAEIQLIDGVSEWNYDLNDDGTIDFREVDRDGDGVIDTYQFDSDFDGAFDYAASRAGLRYASDRTFIFFVDGVPLADMRDLWDEGYFREFHRPSGMVSPFPSMTYLSFAEILGTPDPPGYEELYFDIERNKTVGGLGSRLLGDEDYETYKNESFLTLMGYKQPGSYSGLVYIAAQNTTRRDLRNALEFFDASDARMVIAYMGTTDGLAHKLGREPIREIMREIDQILRHFIYEHRGRLRVIVASDHGNNYAGGKRIDLDGHLEQYGFRVAASLEDSTDVVIPSYGLVGFAAAYLDERREEDFARAAVTAPGVDLATWETDGVVHVLATGGRGRARIRHDADTDRYSYEMVEGDPLDLAAVVAALDEEGRLDADGFAADADWFELTRNHVYVDAVRRVYQGTTNSVVNTANVILSFEDGYIYGSKFFDLIVNLAGTHGSLIDTSTLGFILCNYEEPPEFVRTYELRECLDLPGPDDQAGLQRPIP